MKDTLTITEVIDFEIYLKNSTILFLHIPNSIFFEARRLMITWSCVIKTIITVQIEKSKESDFTHDIHELIFFCVKGKDVKQMPEVKIDSIIKKRDTLE